MQLSYIREERDRMFAMWLSMSLNREKGERVYMVYVDRMEESTCKCAMRM